MQTTHKAPAWVSAVAVIPVALLVGGCCNGMVARIFQTLSVEGLTSPFLGVSPFELLAVVIGAWLMLAASAASDSHFGLAELLMLLVLLVPSSAVAWAATGVYAAYHIATVRGCSRTGAMLFFGLAITALWSSIGIHVLALPVTMLDARAVAGLLGVLRDDIVQTGNVVGLADGHALIVLTACSSLDGLPKVLLGIAAVAAFLGPVDARRLSWGAAGAVLVYVVANDVRLAFMTWSGEFYAVVHSPIGANLFDLFQTALVLWVGSAVSRQGALP